MFHLTPNQSFLFGVGALWVFSAAVSALDPPSSESGPFYRWFYKFAKMIAGDLASTALGKYMPGVSAIAKNGGTAAVLAILCLSLVFAPILGCTQQQKVSVAQEIVNWTPALTSAVNTAGGLVETLDPPSALLIAPTLAAVNALSPQLVAAAKTYLANPSQTTIQTLQALITQLQNSVNTALLNAAKITNPQSQQKATTAVNGIATVVNSLLALIESVSSKQQVAAMSQQVTVRLAAVRPLLDQGAMQEASDTIARDLRVQPVSVDRYFAYQAQAGF
jgi:hypothetical protein